MRQDDEVCTCQICNKPIIGSKNTCAHPGECSKKWQQRRNVKLRNPAVKAVIAHLRKESNEARAEERRQKRYR